MDEIRYSKELRESIPIRSGKKTATNKGETNFRTCSPKWGIYYERFDHLAPHLWILCTKLGNWHVNVAQQTLCPKIYKVWLHFSEIIGFKIL